MTAGLTLQDAPLAQTDGETDGRRMSRFNLSLQDDKEMLKIHFHRGNVVL